MNKDTSRQITQRTLARYTIAKNYLGASPQFQFGFSEGAGCTVEGGRGHLLCSIKSPRENHRQFAFKNFLTATANSENITLSREGIQKQNQTEEVTHFEFQKVALVG
jgi:hypothetical protein